MHIVWKKEMEFEDFIRDTVSNIKYPSIALYANVVLVESYFEFMTRILLEQFDLTEAEEKNWQQATAIDQLAGKRYRIIDQDDKQILHAVRKLRNKLVHNIRFEPDLNTLKDFIKTCFKKSLEPSDELKYSSSSEELQRFFCHQIVIAYATVSYKYKQQVDKKIANHLKTRPMS